MSADTYWFRGLRFVKLRRLIGKTALLRLAMLQEYCALAGQPEAQEAIVRRFIARLLRDIDAQRIANQQAADGYGGPWPYALQLLGDERPLFLRLMRDQDALCGRKQPKIAPEQALCASLNLHAHDAVLVMLSPEAPHRARVWRELRPLCRLCWDPNQGSGQVLAKPFLVRLERELRAMKNPPLEDQNSQRLHEKLKEYFLEFEPALHGSPNHASSDDAEADPAERIDPAMVQLIVETTDARARLQIPLERAKRALPPLQQACFEHYMDEAEGIATETALGLCVRLGITPEDYGAHVTTARKAVGAAMRRALGDETP